MGGESETGEGETGEGAEGGLGTREMEETEARRGEARWGKGEGERDRARVNPCQCLEVRVSVGSLFGRGVDIGARVRDGGEGGWRGDGETGRG